MFLIPGFLMATAGLGMLFLGSIPLGQGQRLPELRGRSMGVALILFLPLAIFIRLLRWPYPWADAATGGALFLSLAISIWLLLPPLLAARARRRVVPTVAARPFKLAPTGPDEPLALPDPEPLPKATPGRTSGSRKRPGHNPFDFS